MIIDTTNDSGKLTMGFHEGRISNMLAQRYPKLHDVILEIIQNQIDSNAEKAEILIDLKKGKVNACDNGDGTSKSDFENAISKICRSIKTDSTRRGGLKPLGQFGIALISPANKCERYSFISRSPMKEQPGFIEYIFDGIADPNLSEIPGIPFKARPDLDKQNLQWNTFVVLRNLVKDKTITEINLDKLVQDVIERYGEAIRESKIELKITFISRDGFPKEVNIVPPEFEGEQLDAVSYTDEKTGNVKFEIYLRSKAEPISKLKFLFTTPKSSYRIPWRLVAKQAEGHIGHKQMEILSNGFLEGLITIDKLDFLPERNAFVENDALTNFFKLLEKWCDEVAAPLVRWISERKRSAKFQEVARRSLALIDEYMKTNRYMFESILSELCGAISTGHTKIGEGEILSMPALGSGISKKRPRTESEAHPSKQEKGEQKKRIHTVVLGPSGGSRTRIKGQLGFALEFDLLQGSIKRCVLNQKEGKITINIRHPDFIACEESDSRLTRYLSTLILNELIMHTHSDTIQYGANIHMEKLAPALCFVITQGDRISGARIKKE